jgi:hypothetical protein
MLMLAYICIELIDCNPLVYSNGRTASPPATTYQAEQSWMVSAAAVVGGSTMYADASDMRPTIRVAVDMIADIL